MAKNKIFIPSKYSEEEPVRSKPQVPFTEFPRDTKSSPKVSELKKSSNLDFLTEEDKKI